MKDNDPSLIQPNELAGEARTIQCHYKLPSRARFSHERLPLLIASMRALSIGGFALLAPVVAGDAMLLSCRNARRRTAARGMGRLVIDETLARARWCCVADPAPLETRQSMLSAYRGSRGQEGKQDAGAATPPTLRSAQWLWVLFKGGAQLSRGQVRYASRSGHFHREMW